MSTAAGWVGTGVHAFAALLVFFILTPGSSAFEAWLAWGLLLVGYVANTVRFVAEALKFGRWPEAPAKLATNWVRYTGAGVGTAGLLGSFVALSRGGVRQFFFTVVAVLAYYTLFLFAALAFETDEAVIAFFVIGAVLFVGAVCIYYMHGEYGRERLPKYVAWISFTVEALFIVATGLEVFKRHTLSNSTQDWVFVSISIAKGVWYLIVYLGGTKDLALFADVGYTHGHTVTQTVFESESLYHEH